MVQRRRRLRLWFLVITAVMVATWVLIITPPRVTSVITHPQRPRPQGIDLNDHYSLDPSVMTPAFLAHLHSMHDKISRLYPKQWRAYDHQPIEACPSDHPECTLWRDVLRLRGDSAYNISMSKPYRKCCVEHAALVKTLRDVVRVLVAANVTYFLSTGTALGAVRHHGTIIPWDTDVDLAIFPRDAHTAEAALRAQRAHYVERDPQGKPMLWVHRSRDGRPRGGIHVEVFFDRVYTDRPQLLLPLTPCELYGDMYNCPNVSIFERWFPGGWHSYSGCHFHGDGHFTVYEHGKRRDVSSC